MPNKMTPLQAAEKLDSLIDYAGDTLDDALEFNLREVVNAATLYLRRVASGKLQQVIHAHFKDDKIRPELPEYYTGICSNCGMMQVTEVKYCGHCGALMDGKDDSHE